MTSSILPNISLPIVPVTVPDLENLVTNIVDPVDPTVAVAEADTNCALINTGVETEFQFVQQLVQQAAPTSCAAAAVYAAMYGSVPSSAELNLLTTQFTPAQFACASQMGVADPTLYCYQSLGLALAQMSDTGSTSFATSWGPANASCPNTPDGNAAFVAQAYAAVFGHAGTQVQIDAFINQVNFFDSLYTASSPVAGADADTICLLARGAVFGLMVGVAVENNIGPLADQVTNFLEDAGQDTALFGAALAVQPDHNAFEGEVSLTIGATLTAGGDDISAGANAVILAPEGTLGTGDTIDAAGSACFLVGSFIDGATPTIRNVDTVELIADTNGGTLNFDNITGLHQAFICGNSSPSDTSTTFADIPLGTPIGIENCMGPGNVTESTPNMACTFAFAGATGTESAALTVSKAGVFTDLEDTNNLAGVNVTINKIGALSLHVAADSNIDGLVCDSLTKLTVDGTANLRIDTDSGHTPVLALVDATQLTGKFVLDDESVTQAGLVVKLGSGDCQVETDASSAQQIYMDAHKQATDVYAATSFDNLKAATSAQISTDAGCDAACVQIFNFSTAQDKIDLSDIVTKGFEDGTLGLGLTVASGRIYIATAQQDATCNSLGSLSAAAQFVAANDGDPANRTCDVFEYKGSTYLFDDANGSGVMTAGAGSADGLIKLVGVVEVSLANFV